MGIPKRAKVTSTIRDEQKQITGPPREVFYIDTRQGEIEPVEEAEDDKPILRRPQRSSMPSLIIHAFAGAVICYLPLVAYTMISMYDKPNPRNLASPSTIFARSITSSLLENIPFFLIGGCVGALVWAMTRRMR